MKALLGTLTLFISIAAPAWGHLDLQVPTSRYGANVLKVGPCGRADGTRSAHVTEFHSGATIDVTWDEYVDHPGHFRIAFDDDGDDDFVDPVCLGGCNTRSPTIERYSNSTVLLDGIVDTATAGMSTVTVTLPDVECERCTLQVIQVMYDKPPYVIPGNDIYYQCADLVLRGRPSPTQTALPTHPWTAAPTSNPTSTPTPPCDPRLAESCAGECPGDCDGSDIVTVNELITLVNIALGTSGLAQCQAGNTNADSMIGIDEIIAAVNRSLNGCAAL